MSLFRWGKDVFRKNASTGRISHELDLGHVASGYEHDNQFALDEHDLRIRLTVRVGMVFEEYAFVGGRTTTVGDCLVDTGACHSVFQAQVARALNLPPGNKIRKCTGFDGESFRWFCVYPLTLAFQPYGHGFLVSGHFPIKGDKEAPIVDSQGNYLFDNGYKGRNIIGVSGVLSDGMLCFTPERLFVWIRTKTKEGESEKRK